MNRKLCKNIRIRRGKDGFDMDYSAAAENFMRKVPVLMRTHTQQKMGEFAKGEMFILNYLALQNREILPSELSAVMGASSARVAAALNSLEHKGKIVRRMDNADRRKILVQITQSGRAQAEEARCAIKQRLSKIFMLLGEADTSEYLRITERIIRISEAADMSMEC